MIELQNVTKRFAGKETVVALHDVSLKIEDGNIFGIVGMSGAGKSTLVRCINLLERPTEGHVLIDSQDMTALTPAQLREKRRGISMIFQQFNLLMQRSCLKNVCFPMEIAGVPAAQARKRAMELLEIVGLPDKADAYPAQLSGGQKQRIAIARALASDPKILLCDEATSALDPNTTRSILRLIKEINQKLGITVVIITPIVSFFITTNCRLQAFNFFSTFTLYGLIFFFKLRKSSFFKMALYISLPRSTRLWASSIRKIPLQFTPSLKNRFNAA